MTPAIAFWMTLDLAATGPGATTVAPVAVELQAEWSPQYGELVRQIALGERLFPRRGSLDRAGG